MKYRSHAEYLRAVRATSEARRSDIEAALIEHFSDVLEERPATVLNLGELDEARLCTALIRSPKILKPLLAACNMGKRALRKDLGVEIDTFRPRIDAPLALKLAEYLIPVLPSSISLEALLRLDGYQFVDSAIRKAKGRWERTFLEGLLAAGHDVRKRKFQCDGQAFELDIASPSKGHIAFAVDVKMIGHPSDKHKRGDEIVNKAIKFKKVYPKGVFVSLVYYPTEEDRPSVESRLRRGTGDIDEVIFAGDDEDGQRKAIVRLAGILSRGERA